MFTKLEVIKYWKKHQFKIIVFSSIFLVFVLYFFNDKSQGTWSLDYTYDPTTKRPRFVKESKGQQECRRVMESLFNAPFPSLRPDFLLNHETGRNLEIDCCNIDLQLGVEYNGIQHYQYHKKMHSSYEDFEAQQRRDALKQELCKKNSFTLITVPYIISVPNIQNYLIHQLRSYGYDV
jgi:hypothetical protein